jgi:hypothetical protein
MRPCGLVAMASPSSLAIQASGSCSSSSILWSKRVSGEAGCWGGDVRSINQKEKVYLGSTLEAFLSD